MSGLVKKNRASLDYAVVDLSQKQNVSKPTNNLYTNVELDSVGNKSRFHREKLQREDDSCSNQNKNSQPASIENNLESVYSELGRETESPQIYTLPNSAVLGRETESPQVYTLPNSEDNTLKSKKADHKVACEVITFISIVLLILAMIICTTISFSMIKMLRTDVEYKLKDISEMASNNSIFALRDNNNTLNLLKKMEKFEADLDLIMNATLGISSLTPASSCQAILAVQPSALSGYYWVSSSNGSSVHVYCEMTMKCNGTRGLQRVALINNKTRSEVCVGELATSNNYCVSRNMTPGCSSTTFIVHGVSYSHVCGALEGYGMNSPEGFNGKESATLNDNYVDGISLTYGGMNNRNHIWTFVGRCDGNYLDSKPGFIHNDAVSCLPLLGSLLGSCQPSNMCSAIFFQVLQQATSENIEMRLCRDQNRIDEDILLRNAEIYVW